MFIQISGSQPGGDEILWGGGGGGMEQFENRVCSFVHLCTKPALFAGTGHFPGWASRKKKYKFRLNWILYECSLVHNKLTLSAP